MPDWFTTLTGLQEESPSQINRNLAIEGTRLTSKANGKSFECGRLDTPSLGELRAKLKLPRHNLGSLLISEVVGDVQELHKRSENAGGTFQVASQFNLLEMVSPNVTPQDGIGIYEHDRTQGPACAIACGAGTAFRNYFVEIDGKLGQSADRQINCLADIGRALGNDGEKLWRMRNGYALPSREGLEAVAAKLSALSEPEIDDLRSKLRVGIHSDVQVTLGDCTHKVTQVYCSAMPVAYSSLPSQLWEPFATLILDAAYEATFLASLHNAARTGNNRLYLTLLGGGAFGNQESWIIGAIRRSIDKFQAQDLDIRIVSFRQSNKLVQALFSSI